MKRFIEGEDRTQVTLLPACLDDYVEAENSVRVVEVFIDGLDLDALGFVGVDPAATGRPAYHPAVLLKLYIYGYLNRIQSSRRLEREAQRNVELMWLTGRLMPDFKTIANFRKDNGRAMKSRDGSIVGYNVQAAVDAKHHLIVAHEVSTEGVDRNQLTPMAEQARAATGIEALTVVADRGYFKGEQILDCEQAGITPILPKALTSNSKADGRFDKQDFVYIAADDEYRCPAGQRAIKRFTTIEHGMTLSKYWSSACPRCPLKARCTPSD